MELIIDIDKIKDPSKRDWLIKSLQLMKIGFETVEKPQTLEEYNADLDAANAAMSRGEFITTEDLLEQMKKW